LQTRAVGPGYAQIREAWLDDGRRAAAERASAASPSSPPAAAREAAWAGVPPDADDGRSAAGLLAAASAASGRVPPHGLIEHSTEPAEDGAAPRLDPDDALRGAPLRVTPSEPSLLTTLPARAGGPIALFEHRGELLVVDLPRLRAWLVEQQLRDELGGDGIAVQALLVPIVLARARAVVAAVDGAREEFTRLGVLVERFDEESLVIRGVPAHLRDVVEEREVGELVDRLLDWFELQRRGCATDEDGVRRLARAGSRDASPRLARRWLRDVLARVGDDPAALARVDGIRAWSGDELVRRR
jgi:DNA mismatch repair protein MutL